MTNKETVSPDGVKKFPWLESVGAEQARVVRVFPADLFASKLERLSSFFT